MFGFKAFLLALTEALKVWRVVQIQSLYKELDSIDDEIFTHANNGDAASKLRLEQLWQRRDRTNQQISDLRPANHNSTKE